LKGDTLPAVGHLKKRNRGGEKDDSQVEVRGISFVLAKEKCEDRQAPQSGDFLNTQEGQRS
jgi:hypothetical protein